MTARNYLRIEDRCARTIVVGDIHGCFDELQRLLGLVGFNREDVLVAVGDLVDRGPRSWEVAEFFRDTSNAYSTLGNHDRRVAGTIRGTSQPAWSQLQTLSLRDQNEWPAWADYFQGLPAVIETPHAIVTHARLEPALPLDKQDPFFTCAVGGPSVVIACDDGGVPLWFKQMDADKPICVGHIGYDRVELVPGKLFAIDTGAVHGGSLTAVVLPEARLVTMRAERYYYGEARSQWQAQESTGNRRLDEWKAACGLPRGEVVDWPMRRVVELLRLEKPIENRTLAEAVRRLESAMAEHELERLCEQARRSLLDRFGGIPEPGAARADYFMGLKSSFPGGKHGQFATRLLANPEQPMLAILQAASQRNLREAHETLLSLTNVLGGFENSGDP